MSPPILETISEVNEICEITRNVKTRKRTRNTEKHKSFQQKARFQMGLEYKTKSGKIVTKKTFHEQTKCDCKRKCADRIDVIRQKQIFDAFYSLKDWTQKTLYLRSVTKGLPNKNDLRSVKCVPKKTKYKYFLVNNKGENEEVCQTFLLQCLQVSSSSVYRAAKSIVTNKTAKERRGQFPTRKIKKRDLKYVKQFIRQYPCYSSHYGANHSNKKYLDPNMNISRLYTEYGLVCNFEKRKKVTESKFRHVFNTCFNLAFHPKKSRYLPQM